jgi:hypothetical protein
VGRIETSALLPLKPSLKTALDVTVELGIAGPGGVVGEGAGHEPRVTTWKMPPRPVREKAAWSSRKLSGARTALSWAARTSATVSASPKGPTSETLFGGENDKAKPVTTVRFESCR